MKPYGFDQDKIPPSYEPLSWFDKRERVPEDYGPRPAFTTAEEWALYKKENPQEFFEKVQECEIDSLTY